MIGFLVAVGLLALTFSIMFVVARSDPLAETNDTHDCPHHEG